DIMQQDVAKMVSGGIQTIDLTIEHVSKRGQRMPETGVTVGEKPFKAGKSQARCNVRILVNVTIVVEINEAVTKRLAKNDPDQDRQSNANRDRYLAILTRTGVRRHRWHF